MVRTTHPFSQAPAARIHFRFSLNDTKPDTRSGTPALSKDARVHYGVLNIRSALPHSPGPAEAAQEVQETSTQDHEVPPDPPRTRSLRTQQRARPRTPRHRTFQTTEAVVLVTAPTFPATNRRCSTHELTTAEQMPAKWLWHHHTDAVAADAP